VANRLKGEIEIKMDGETVALRPSFEGLLEMEDKAGLGLSMLLRRFVAQDWSLKYLTAVIYGGLYHYGDPEKYSFEKVGQAIVKSGLKNFTVPAMALISTSVNPDSAKAKEEKAAEKKE
jgi:hypothetical protein